MSNFKLAKAWLPLCVLLLIGSAITPRAANLQSASSSPNSVKSAAASISTDSFGTVKFPNMNSLVLGDTASSVQSLSVLQNSSPMLRSTSQNPPSLSTNLPFLCPPVSVKDTWNSRIGCDGTIKETATSILICLVGLITLCTLYLVIIVTKFLVLMRLPISKYCFPDLTDRSRRFSIGRPISHQSPISRLESRCMLLLFGRDVRNL